MILPANIQTGRVEARFVADIVDGADPDDEPDIIPILGEVLFDAEVRYWPAGAADGGPMTIVKTQKKAIIDDYGFLCSPDPRDPAKAGPNRYMKLFATDDPDLGVVDWKWKATPRLKDVNGQKLMDAIPPVEFYLPAGGKVDLTDLFRKPFVGAKVPVLVAETTASAAAGAARDAASSATEAKLEAKDAKDSVYRAEQLVVEANNRVGADDAQVAGHIRDGRHTRAVVEGIVLQENQLQVPPLVARAIAADRTVADAATAAVAGAAEGLDLVLSSDGRVPEHGDVPGLSAVVTDKRGNRTHLEADDIDGKPTEFSMSLSGPALRDYMDFVTGSDRRVPVEFDIPGLSVVVTDARRRMTWLRADDVTGGPPPETVAILREALALGEAAAPTVITAGDSITQGGHGGGASWQSVISDLMGGVPVINSGVSGCTAIEIALKQGSWAPVITVTGGMFPAQANTPVDVVLENMPLESQWWSASGQPARSYKGTFEGVPATLTKSKENTWTLQRTTAGAAFETISRTPFLVTPGDPSATWILWPGRNDYPKSNLREPLNRMVRWIRDGGGKFLILSTLSRSGFGTTNSDTVEVLQQNAITQGDYPHEFVNVREYMVRHGIRTAGLTPTAADLSAMAVGGIPPSLMADGLHPNAAGRLAIGTYVYQQMKARGLAS